MQIPKKLKNLLFSFDQFGKPINLLMKKQNRYHTIPGSIVSIGILFFTGFSFLSLILEMLQGQNPNIVSTTTSTKDPALFHLTQENFRISITLSYENGTFIENTPEKAYYRVEFLAIENDIDPNQQTYFHDPLLVQILQIDKCYSHQNSLQTESNQLFKDVMKKINLIGQLDIDRGIEQVNYCIDDLWWKNNPIRMKGTTQTKLYSNFYLQVLTCQKSIDPLDLNAPICAPQEEIDRILTIGWFAINFVDYQLDQLETVPFSPVYKSQYFRFNVQGDFKYVFYYLRHTVMSSIFNPFYYFGQSTVNHVLQYVRHEQTNDKIVENGVFIGIQFFLDQQKVEYQRSQSNILSVLGSISGLFNALITVFSLILLPLCENLMNRTIIEGIFSFQDSTLERNIQRDKSLTRKETIKLGLKRLQTSKPNLLDKQHRIEVKENSVKNILKFKDKGLNIQGFQDFVLSFFTGSKGQQILKGIEGYQSKLDVIFIIKKLIEIDKLKQLLLTQSQMKLFNYIPKPTIKLIERSSKLQVQPEKSEFILDQQSFEREVAESMQAYEEISSQISELDLPESINFKLIQMMDSDIKEAFQDAISLIKPSGTKVESPLNLQPSFKHPIEESQNIFSNREF